MKIIPIDTIKNFARDRSLATVSIALIVLVIAYSIYIALALEPSDLQVATRYTAFGDAHFYRNKWYYLLSFIFFGLTLVGVHLAFAVKLYNRNQRQLATGFLYLTVFLLLIAWIVTRSVLQIAFL